MRTMMLVLLGLLSVNQLLSEVDVFDLVYDKTDRVRYALLNKFEEVDELTQKLTASEATNALSNYESAERGYTFNFEVSM